MTTCCHHLIGGSRHHLLSFLGVFPEAIDIVGMYASSFADRQNSENGSQIRGHILGLPMNFQKSASDTKFSVKSVE